jgi:hypothetical protein
MELERQIQIHCAPIKAFNFLRDKHLHTARDEFPVLALEKRTPGPVRVGTQFYEVVQMFPWLKGTIWSEITRYDPPRFLEERFWGTGMQGHLAYEFVPLDGGTLLTQ